MIRVAIAILLTSSAWAQTGGGVDLPEVGLVFDPEAAAIRQLTGIPAAARLGNALDRAGAVRLAAVASNRGYAIALDDSGTALIVSRNGALPLPAARSGAARIATSPRGTSAALYFSDSRTCQVFTGMPDHPQLARSISLPEDVNDLVVSDDGAAIMALSRGSRGGDTVYAHSPEGEPQVRYRARRISAVNFVPGSTNALIAAPAVVRIVAPDLGEQPAGSDPDSGIVAVAASQDGSRVFTASRSGRIAVHDLRTSTTNFLTCSCSPSALSPLRGDAVFRLNDAGDGPVWLLDADGVTPRIYFVADGGRQ